MPLSNLITLFFQCFYDVWSFVCVGHYITAITGIGAFFCTVALLKKIIFSFREWGGFNNV